LTALAIATWATPGPTEADSRLTLALSLAATGYPGANGEGTADTSDIAGANGAVFAVNGDFFGARGDGIIIRNGQIYRDEPVVDGRNPGYSKGVTTEEFAQIFKDLGCTTAYNLDGGGSSTMYFKGEVVNSPINQGGQRDISDILFVD
jgi:exopolysaccharide biosynthesis protein